MEKLGARRLEKIDAFMHSLREGIYADMTFYVGDAEEMKRRAKVEAERKGVRWARASH